MAAGISQAMIQDSIAYNTKAGTLRGLHYFVKGFPQPRLLRCISGAVFAAIVDLREESQGYMRHATLELTEHNQSALFVPAGVALGYQTLKNGSTVYYQMSQLYDPTKELGVRWNDPAFGIEWPDANRIMLERDARYPDYDAAKRMDT